MGLDEFLINLTNLSPLFPEKVWSRVMDLILVLKALSIVAILYIFYIVIMGILTYRKMKRIDYIKDKTDEINKKINSIDRKLNKLVKKKKY